MQDIEWDEPLPINIEDNTVVLNEIGSPLATEDERTLVEDLTTMDGDDVHDGWHSQMPRTLFMHTL